MPGERQRARRLLPVLASLLAIASAGRSAAASPPVAAVFLLGISWRRVNASGAVAALGTGFFVGVFRLIAELNEGHLSGVVLAFAQINFLHFAVFLFVLCSAVLIGVSLVTPEPSDAQLEGLTFATTPAKSKGKPSRWRAHDRVASAVLILLVCAVWLYFSPWVHSPG